MNLLRPTLFEFMRSTGTMVSKIEFKKVAHAYWEHRAPHMVPDTILTVAALILAIYAGKKASDERLPQARRTTFRAFSILMTTAACFQLGVVASQLFATHHCLNLKAGALTDLNTLLKFSKLNCVSYAGKIKLS